MDLGEESVIMWWVLRIIMAGGMIMYGWVLIFLGRLAHTGKCGRDDAAGIRTANTLASEEVWKVGHIQVSRTIQVTGMVPYISAAWVMIPYFSYYTVSIGFCSIVMSVFAAIGYAIFIADRAAAELLRRKAETKEEQDLQASGCERQRRPREAGWGYTLSPRPVALSDAPSTRPTSRCMTEQWDAHRDFPVSRDVARLLFGVPGWFGREDTNAAYIGVAREIETRTVRGAAGTVVGVTLVAQHLPSVTGVHLMVVEHGHYGREVGRVMIEALERDAQDGGVQLLMIKALGPPHPDSGYARTRRLYERMGLLPLGEARL